jgi:hypothetical protein
MRFFRPAPRSHPAPAVVIETMESRRLLSASGLGGADDCANHDANDANDDRGADVVDNHQGRGADDGANHNANDARRGRGHDDGAGHH